MNITRVTKGELPKAETIDSIIDELNRLNRISVGPGLRISNSQAGISISLLSGEAPLIYQIVSAGPNGEADYTDDRYWISRCYISNADSDPTTETTITAYDSSHPYYEIVTATDISEMFSGGLVNSSSGSQHNLPMNIFVMPYKQTDLSTSPPTIKYYFWMEVSCPTDGNLYCQLWSGGTVYCVQVATCSGS